MRQREKKNSMAGAVAACRLTSELALLLLRITVERAACYSWSWAVPAPRRPGYSRLCHGHRCSEPATLPRCRESTCHFARTAGAGPRPSSVDRGSC